MSTGRLNKRQSLFKMSSSSLYIYLLINLCQQIGQTKGIGASPQILHTTISKTQYKIKKHNAHNQNHIKSTTI